MLFARWNLYKTCILAVNSVTVSFYPSVSSSHSQRHVFDGKIVNRTAQSCPNMKSAEGLQGLPVKFPTDYVKYM